MCRSIRARAIGLTLFLSLLPLFSLGIYSYLVAKGATLQVQIRSIRSHAEELARDLDEYLAERQRDILLIARHPAIRSFSVATPEARPILRAQAQADLTNFLEVNAHYEAAYLLDPSGRALLSMAEDPDPHAASRPYFLRALAGETYASEPSLLAGSGRAVIYFSAPVPHPGGKGIAGVAVLRVRAEELWRIVEKEKDRLGEGSLATLFDEYGIRLAHARNRRMIFRAVASLPRHTERRLLAEGRFGTLKRIGSLPFPDLAQGLREPARRPYFIHHLADSPDRYHAVAVPLRTRRWTVVESVPEAAFLAPVNHFTRNALWLGAGIALLALFVARMGARSMVNSLSLLTRSALRMGEGDLSTPVSLQREDELGQLAQSLEQMRASLADAFERERRLQGQVEERARELSREIVAQNQYAEGVLRSIADGVYSTDLERRIQSWSQGAEAITGFEEEEVRGTSCRDLLQHCDEEGKTLCDTDCPILQVLQRGQPVSVPEAWVHTRNGGRVPVAVTVSPLFDLQGEVSGTVEVFRDISRERELRENILRASQAKNAFLSTMSHELRTPLSAIISLSEMLGEHFFGELSPKQAQCINDILDSGRQLLALINDILDLSRAEAGEVELQWDEFSLRSLLEASLKAVSREALEKEIALSLRVEEGLKTLVADANKVRQVLLNLLSNAIKFTPAGGRAGIEVHRHGDCVAVAVWDTGIGIAPQDQGRLFQPFQQIDNSLARQYGGTGLGLCLARKWVELHGGEIWVESGLGEGSRFTFTLPLQGRDSLQGKALAGKELLRVRAPSLENQSVLLPYASFYRHLERMINLSRRQERSLAVIHLRWGGAGGSLREGALPVPAGGLKDSFNLVVRIIQDRIRSYDAMGRGRGDLTLFLLFPDTPIPQAQEVAQRCRVLLEEKGIGAEARVVVYPQDGQTAEELIQAVSSMPLEAKGDPRERKRNPQGFGGR
ncbi:MAG: PAS domain S-box protein [Candidatus Tectomicrobia bacterium]|uniref:histidine kinase n=1 Tax=Tectimicrobiota bacterium TaxID=2528274 RepID=A0A932FXA4_UNCTE|nr:PAS domain S-box protein [Candidatus Tectomicrobia bacterium]